MKIIQIAVSDDTLFTTGCLFALGDDGSLWRHLFKNKADWEKCDLPPTAETVESANLHPPTGNKSKPADITPTCKCGKPASIQMCPSCFDDTLEKLTGPA